ncbi:MAG: hypothetical protein JSU82_00760 [Rhodospirillales bacterium]|nr:MAG: hypothetical protein JSU82_00760 [Rhodospirillales bacterium]
MPTLLLGGPVPGSGPLAIGGEQRGHLEDGSTRSVTVAITKTVFQRGEIIAVTLTNTLSTAIYAPPVGPSYCSVVSIQKMEAGKWSTQGSCNGVPTPPTILLEPNTVMSAALVIEADPAPSRAPILGEPQKPRIVDEGPTTGPPPAPGKPGDLTPIYPEGTINVRGLLYPIVQHSLSPGTYRIVFAFAEDDPRGSIETVYSEPFQVVG